MRNVATHYVQDRVNFSHISSFLQRGHTLGLKQNAFPKVDAFSGTWHFCHLTRDTFQESQKYGRMMWSLGICLECGPIWIGLTNRVWRFPLVQLFDELLRHGRDKRKQFFTEDIGSPNSTDNPLWVVAPLFKQDAWTTSPTSATFWPLRSQTQTYRYRPFRPFFFT